MTQIYCEVWAQFQPTKDGKWSMKAWQDKPDWMPDGKFYLVRVPVPAELIGEPVVAVVESSVERAGAIVERE